MRQVTCINQSCYSEALTYGRCYEALAIDDAGQHPKVKLQGDNQRVRWFPRYCFDMRGSPVPLLNTITLHDDPNDAAQGRVEVDLHFSDGQRRWCWIATPHGLAQAGDTLPGTDVRIHFDMPHLIVVSALNETLMWQALRYVERQGALFRCSLPIEPAQED